MSKPLEPTDEQWAGVTLLLRSMGIGPSAGGDAYRVWDLIRDHVLEAAAVECEEYRDDTSFDLDDAASAIRALKGATAPETPPPAAAAPAPIPADPPAPPAGPDPRCPPHRGSAR